MNYDNEHLLPGQIGHFFVVLSFVAALFAAFSYFIATQRRAQADGEQWLKLGRWGFIVHGLSIMGVIGALFFILLNKYYEYHYAWANISDDLPSKYVFSAFWKEQQGSFLLWSFWNVVLGLVLLLRSGRWEAPVVFVVAITEAIIASMILGIYFGDFRLGASAFDLLRDSMNGPVFQQKDYLTQIKGQGLNPLLQNYWMTIHPPTLFLGFASTLIPFAYAFAGLWTREHKAWLRPALPWALFSGGILGLGILMGAAWAYEALSFAGYWAWDPVENTSLVPWLTLVAGIHTNLVARSTGHSIRSTYGFYLITFILVLYSTYLTRSGILGDTSAHAFTEMGLSFQLILFIGVFSALALGIFIARLKNMPKDIEEEKLQSREFWMFMGALVLLFSAVLITGATSLPVYNKIVALFNPDYTGATLKDPVEHHNRYQTWIAVFIGLLSGVGQWLRYGEKNWGAWQKKFFTHLTVALLGAVAITALSYGRFNTTAWQHIALLGAAIFTLIANLDYLFSALKGNIKIAASALSHTGFGVLILGILATGLNKRWVSSNPFAMDGLVEGMDEAELKKNVTLMKDAPMPIADNLTAIYVGDTMERQTRTFKVIFKERDSLGNFNGDSFVVYPNVMYDRQFTKVVASNPSTQHYWNYDIFTHVAALPKAELEPEFAKQMEDSLQFDQYEALVGDTIFTKKHYLIVDELTRKPQHPDYHAEPGDLAFGLNMRAFSMDDPNVYWVSPMMYLRPGKGGFTLASNVGQLQMRARLTSESMERLLALQDELTYQTFTVSQAGDVFNYKGFQIRFNGPDREVEHPDYQEQNGDIAVAAQLEITAPDGKTYSANPVYLIRGSRPFSLKDQVAAHGLHVQFEKVDPQTRTFTLGIAQADKKQRAIPVEIAENAARSDYIVVEAIVFPGIKLVWYGSIVMLLGLALSLWRRWNQN